MTLRHDMTEFLSSLPVTLSLVLRYHAPPISIDTMRRHLHDLHFRVDRKIYRRDLHKSPTRSGYWAVIEKLDTNPHLHIGWHFPNPADASILEEFVHGGLWQERYALGGTTYVGAHYPGWAGYSCKRLRDTDHVILSPKGITVNA